MPSGGFHLGDDTSYRFQQAVGAKVVDAALQDAEGRRAAEDGEHRTPSIHINGCAVLVCESPVAVEVLCELHDRTAVVYGEVADSLHRHPVVPRWEGGVEGEPGQDLPPEGVNQLEPGIRFPLSVEEAPVRRGSAE